MSERLAERVYSCSISDACQMSGIGRSRMYELIRDDLIEIRYEGTKPLVIVDSLLAYVRSLPKEKAKAAD